MNIFKQKIKINIEERLSLYEKFAVFIKEGVSLNKIIATLAKEFLDLDHKDKRGIFLKEVLKELDKGIPFYQSIAPYIPASEALIIQAGEESSDFATAFEKAAFLTRKNKEIFSVILKAMTVPALLMCFLLIYIVGSHYYILPKIVQAVPLESWTGISLAYYNITAFVSNNFYIIILSLVLLAFIINLSLEKATGEIRDFLDKIPPYSVYKSIQSSSFLLTLSILTATGKPIYDSFIMIRKLTKPYTKSKINLMIEKINRGSDIGNAIKSNFFDKETLIDLAVLAKLKGLDKSIATLAEISLEKTQKRVLSTSSIATNVILFSILFYMIFGYLAITLTISNVGSTF